MRNATFEGCEDSSVAGTESLWVRWSEKSISRPPLEGDELGGRVEGGEKDGRTYVNSTVRGISSAIFSMISSFKFL